METIIRIERTYRINSKEEKLQLLAECKTCGITIKRSCENRGINRFTLNSYTTDGKARRNKKQSVFIPVAIPEMTPERRLSQTGICT